MADSKPGPALYVVATPIGNLDDITLRALRVLKEADLIACEDTRQTQKLLTHYGISTRTISYHEHNEMTRAAELITDLEQGYRVALVSDAGMPGISDPGYRLITLAIRHKVPVVPVPGPSAVVAALVASGLPTDSFAFRGFLPAKQGQRKSALEAVAASPRTQVFYEAPHRIVEALIDVVDVLGAQRRVVVAREVTKMHEEFLRGTAEEILDVLQARQKDPTSGGIKGEITLLIARSEKHGDVAGGPLREAQGGEADGGALPAAQAGGPPLPAAQGGMKDIHARLAAIMREQKLDEKSALKVLAKETGRGKSDLYRELQRKKKQGPGKARSEAGW